MKKHLINSMIPSFKANLHCHSNISDGLLSPEELKKAYKAKGYSVLSITDHEVLIAHPELDEDGFLALPGYEMSIDQPGPGPFYKTCHMNLFPKKKGHLTQVCFHEKYVFGEARNHLDKIKWSGEPMERTYSPACINEIIRMAGEQGFLVSYNHPTWSQECYNDYINYEGFFAMEVYNTSCRICVPENNIRVYREMAQAGKRLYCIATDDNHNYDGLEHYKNDSFGGFTMISAESLTHEAVTAALERGDCYASAGPLIHDLYIEEGKVYVSCSPAKAVYIYDAGRAGDCIIARKAGTITEAVFWLPTADKKFFIIEVVDEEGNQAYTRAYFADEWENKTF